MATSPALVPSILEFWFGSADPTAQVPTRTEVWFGGGEAFDAECRRRFLSTLQGLARGEGAAWADTPGGRLASVIVLDQLSRNIYRDTPQAFAQDARALHLARQGVELGVDRLFGFHQRAFFYLPFEHSEDRAVQRRSVELYTALRADAPPGLEKAAEVYLDFALRHQEIVERFGRFPHRNSLLGRTTTSEEFRFLRTPGSSF